MLELGEDLFDRIEVGGVFRQEEELGAGRADELANGFALVSAEIVHDDDVAVAQRGYEHPLDVSAKALAVDRPLQQPGCFDPVEPERGHEGRRLPTPMRDLGDEALTARRPAAPRRHVGLGPGLIDEDQALRLDATLILDPLRSPPRHVGPVALASHQAFF
jgi:hypothetical protein